MSASIGNQRSTSGRIHVPAYGDWCAHVRTDSDVLLSGSVKVAIGDLALTGVIDDAHSGISESCGFYLVRGAPLWDVEIAERAYQTDAGGGVRLRTIIRDCAQDAGVDVATVDFPTDVRIGSAWGRVRGPARRTLDALRAGSLAPAWYVSTAGRTVFGARTSGAIGAAARVKRRRPDLGVTYVRVDSEAAWVPGLSFEGVVLASVLYRWTPEDAIVELRT